MPSGPFRTTTYIYDELYRLTGETVAGGGTGISPVGSVSYTLDKVGNRESRTSTMATVTGIADYDYDARDRLTTIDGRSLDYSRAGSTTAGTVTDLGLDGVTGGPLATLGSGTTYADVYDFEERLIQRTYADGTQVIMTYDADGFRVGKTIFSSASALISTTSYLVCTNNLTGYAQVLEERTTSADGNDVRIYSYGSDLIGQDRQDPASGAWAYSFYGYDGHGSVCELFDDAGQITDTYTYDAFGVVTARTGTTPNHYRYAGEQFDEDLGLSYNRARYLNLNTGRFWSMDEYEGSNADPVSLHKYLYAHADPVTFEDPTGHMALDLSLAQAIHSQQQRSAAVSLRSRVQQAKRGLCFASYFAGEQVAHHILPVFAGPKRNGGDPKNLVDVDELAHEQLHRLIRRMLQLNGLPAPEIGKDSCSSILNDKVKRKIFAETIRSAYRVWDKKCSPPMPKLYPKIDALLK